MLNRNAQFLDVSHIALGIVAFILVSIFVSYLIDTLQVQFNQTDPNNTILQDIIDENKVKYKDTMDGSSLIVAGFLIIVAGILAIIVPAHWIFVILGFIFGVVIVIFGGIMSDVFVMFTNQTVLNATAIQYTNSRLVMSNFPMILLVADVVFTITMFIKIRWYQ